MTLVPKLGGGNRSSSRDNPRLFDDSTPVGKLKVPRSTDVAEKNRQPPIVLIAQSLLGRLDRHIASAVRAFTM